MVQFAEYTVTCKERPFQVEGTTTDGRHFYFRYRYCSIWFGTGATLDEAVDRSDGHPGITRHAWTHEDSPAEQFCSEELTRDEVERYANQIEGER